MRMLPQIPDRYGKVPHNAATIVTSEKTYDGRVKGDGTVLVKPLITEENNEKGEREFVHRFLTDRQKEKLREQGKKKGQRLVETGPGDPVTAEVHIGGDLMVIGSAEGLRTMAKIAYVELARFVGVKVAAGDAFREVGKHWSGKTSLALTRTNCKELRAWFNEKLENQLPRWVRRCKQCAGGEKLTLF